MWKSGIIHWSCRGAPNAQPHETPALHDLQAAAVRRSIVHQTIEAPGLETGIRAGLEAAARE